MIRIHAVALLFVLGTVPVAAQTGASVGADEAEQARSLTDSGAILPLEQILERTKQEFPGRVIEIELDKEDGRYVYELEIVDPEGRVWELEIDAATGELIEKEREDD
ncbi:MAG TPA: PepSY domain-containing protein [Gammaproteobacteria bacterium]|jgi:uncharacterized membrane protein YkoI